MRLRSAWISHYKNLKDFLITFEGDGFIDIFVGRNGSGKSNFLEALIEIFDHLFDFDRGEAAPTFDYSVAYELNGTTIAIEWKGGSLSVNGQSRKTIGQTPRPENVIVYYSGQNRNVADLVERYETRFRRRIRGADLAESPAFIGIGPDYKKLLILLLLLLPEERRARQFLCSKLGILGTRAQVTLRLGRPVFAQRRPYDHLDPADLFWGLEGVTRAFLDDLVTCIEGGATPGALHNRDTDRYEMTLSVVLFRRVFEARRWDELFGLFNNLKILEMLDDISMDVTLRGLELSDLGLFSDGQFQSVYLFAIAELFKDRNCVTLLDEPDAFLHPEWQFEFLKQVDAISGQAAATNHVLLSSHSASTIAADTLGRIRMFALGEDGVELFEKDKAELVKSLSAGLITFSEKEARLEIEHVIDNANGPILFAEGVSDVKILRSAWDKLYPGVPRPFEIEQAFGASFLRNLLKSQSLFEANPGRRFFGLFDFDQAYADWVQLGDCIEEDVRRCLTRKRAGAEGYAMLLPVPENLPLRVQAIRPDGNTFGDGSRLPIELLFYGIDGLENHFGPDTTEIGQPIKFLGNKVQFAENVVPALAARHFAPFAPIFEFIRSKI